jgi:pyrroline-5-carboxylate reductase
MRLGFVGTGTITAAIVRGLGAACGEQGSILLSPRSADVSAALAAQFAHVQVVSSNQAVLDGSDVVMLAVRPQIARAVIPELRFRPGHHVISLIATLSLETLTGLVAPARTVSKAVPIPTTALGSGPTAIYPPDPVAAALFARIGTAIQVERPEIFDTLTVATATMAAYFTFADAIAAWLTQRGVAAADARLYVGTIFEGLARTAAGAPDQSFAALATEHATRGGLNEQLARHLTDSGLFAAMADGMDAILRRIEAQPEA